MAAPRDAGVWLRIPGTAEDRLYREGALPSFWETLFGAGLQKKRRTAIGMNERGCRTFDVPAEELVQPLRDRLTRWAERSGAPHTAILRSPSRPLDALSVRLSGEQPPGTAVATFTLSVGIPGTGPDALDRAAIESALEAWWADEGPGVARDALAPFGFTAGSPLSRG